jgi:hypothetical protein
MKKNDAIAEIKAQAKMSKGIMGFQVLSMDAHDVDEYLSDEIKARFEKMSKKQKQAFLSLLMDEVNDTLEESLEYGFRKLLADTVEMIDVDELMERAENE